MENNLSRVVTEWTITLLLVILAITAGGCQDRDNTGRTQTSDVFETARAFIHSWLSEADTDRLLISSARLKEKIVDDWENQSDTYQIVSVRSEDDYLQAGHIPHAINSYWVNTVTDESLAQLDSSKTLILYCYYGHGSMISSTILNLLGYKSYSLDFGMMDWNLDALVKEPWDRQADYALETVENRPQASYSAPAIQSARTDARSIIAEMADKYFSGEGSPVIRAAEVKAIVEDWDRMEGEYQIVDVRSSASYDRGHIPHSIHIPWAEITAIENLKKLDPHRTIIVCSENGQTGQLAATVLNLLNYRAINILFGMMDWNRTAVAVENQWDGIAGYPVAHEDEAF